MELGDTRNHQNGLIRLPTVRSTSHSTWRVGDSAASAQHQSIGGWCLPPQVQGYQVWSSRSLGTARGAAANSPGPAVALEAGALPLTAPRRSVSPRHAQPNFAAPQLRSVTPPCRAVGLSSTPPPLHGGDAPRQQQLQHQQQQQLHISVRHASPLWRQAPTGAYVSGSQLASSSETDFSAAWQPCLGYHQSHEGERMTARHRKTSCSSEESTIIALDSSTAVHEEVAQVNTRNTGESYIPIPLNLMRARSARTSAELCSPKQCEPSPLSPWTGVSMSWAGSQLSPTGSFRLADDQYSDVILPPPSSPRRRSVASRPPVPNIEVPCSPYGSSHVGEVPRSCRTASRDTSPVHQRTTVESSSDHGALSPALSSECSPETAPRHIRLHHWVEGWSQMSGLDIDAATRRLSARDHNLVECKRDVDSKVALVGSEMVTHLHASPDMAEQKNPEAPESTDSVFARHLRRVRTLRDAFRPMLVRSAHPEASENLDHLIVAAAHREASEVSDKSSGLQLLQCITEKENAPSNALETFAVAAQDTGLSLAVAIESFQAPGSQLLQCITEKEHAPSNALETFAVAAQDTGLSLAAAIESFQAPGKSSGSQLLQCVAEKEHAPSNKACADGLSINIDVHGDVSECIELGSPNLSCSPTPLRRRRRSSRGDSQIDNKQGFPTLSTYGSSQPSKPLSPANIIADISGHSIADISGHSDLPWAPEHAVRWVKWSRMTRQLLLVARRRRSVESSDSYAERLQPPIADICDDDADGVLTPRLMQICKNMVRVDISGISAVETVHELESVNLSTENSVNCSALDASSFTDQYDQKGKLARWRRGRQKVGEKSLRRQPRSVGESKRVPVAKRGKRLAFGVVGAKGGQSAVAAAIHVAAAFATSAFGPLASSSVVVEPSVRAQNFAT